MELRTGRVPLRLTVCFGNGDGYLHSEHSSCGFDLFTPGATWHRPRAGAHRIPYWW